MAAVMVQPAISLSRMFILTMGGTWFANSVILKDGKLADLLSKIKGAIPSTPESVAATKKGLEDLMRQLERDLGLLREAGREVVVINGEGNGNGTKLLTCAATAGALGYGYIRWKGLSLSQIMYVTKKRMDQAVETMKKQLEQVNETVAAAKRHLTQRIEGLDGKLDEQKEMSHLIKNEVTDVRTDISQIGFDLNMLQKMVSGLDVKINTLEEKQDYANAGVSILVDYVKPKDEAEAAKFVQSLPAPCSKTRGLLEHKETPSLMKGLKHIADSINSKKGDLPMACVSAENDVKVVSSPTKFIRSAIKC